MVSYIHSSIWIMYTGDSTYLIAVGKGNKIIFFSGLNQIKIWCVQDQVKKWTKYGKVWQADRSWRERAGVQAWLCQALGSVGQIHKSFWEGWARWTLKLFPILKWWLKQKKIQITTLFSEFYSIFLIKTDVGLNNYETNIRFHITLHWRNFSWFTNIYLKWTSW